MYAMNSVIWILVVQWSFLSTSAKDYVISASEEGQADLTLYTGDTATLICDLKDDTETVVMWFSSQTQSYITRNNEVRNPTLRDRCSAVVNYTSLTYTLSINDVQESDAGTYECYYLADSRAEFLASAHLNVVPGPTSTPECDITYLPSVAKSNEGQNLLDVSCSWTSNYTKVVANLFQNDSKILSDINLGNRIIKRVNLDESDSSVMFRCEISLPELHWMRSCSIQTDSTPLLKAGISPLISNVQSDSSASLDCYGEIGSSIPMYSIEHTNEQIVSDTPNVQSAEELQLSGNQWTWS